MEVHSRQNQGEMGRLGLGQWWVRQQCGLAKIIALFQVETWLLVVLIIEQGNKLSLISR